MLTFVSVSECKTIKNLPALSAVRFVSRKIITDRALALEIALLRLLRIIKIRLAVVVTILFD